MDDTDIQLGPPMQRVSDRDPTAQDDIAQGFREGYYWKNRLTRTLWVCTDDGTPGGGSPGTAVWVPIVFPFGYQEDPTNVGYGTDALGAVTTAARNVAIGDRTMASHQTGDDNVAAGSGALANTGDSGTLSTTAVGSNALAALGGGSSVPQYVTAVGAGAGEDLLDAEELTLIGNNALNGSTVSYFSAVVGSNAGAHLDDCNYSVLIGAFAGLGASGGAVERCVIIGDSAGLNVSAIQHDVLIGNSAGATLTTGDGNTLIGTNADVSGGAVSNAIAIGRGAIATQDNELALGSAAFPLLTTPTVYEGGIAIPSNAADFLVVNVNGTLKGIALFALSAGSP